MAALVPSPQALASSRSRRGREYLLFFNSAILVTYVAAAAEVTQAPFNQDDWPNPSRKKVAQQPLDTPNLLTTTLAKRKVQPPFNQEDWANPTKHPDTRVSLLWFNSAILPLIEEEVVVAQTPFHQDEWANPIRKAVRDYSYYQSSREIPQVPTTDAFGTPFYQTEHPNPQLHKESRISLLWFNSAILPQSDQAGPAEPAGTEMGFNQFNWPNPNIHPDRRISLLWFNSVILPQSDQPEQEGARYTFREALVSPPIRRIREKEWGWVQSAFPSDVVAATAPPPPFYETDHPNPINLRPDWRDYTWTQNPYIEFIVPSGPEIIPEPPVEVGPPIRYSGRPHLFWKPKLRVPKKVLEVIEEVAQNQVDRLETDKQKQFEELERELEARSIEWEARYLEALNQYREYLIEQEIGEILRNKKKRDDEIISLLMAVL